MLVLVVIACGLLAAIAVVLLRSSTSAGQPLDVEREEQWLITHSPGWLARLLRPLDHRVAGGVVVGASLIALFAAALIVGWIFSGIDDESGIARWDVAAAEWGRDNATDRSTMIFEAVTNLGGTVVLATVMVLIGVYHAVRHRDRGPALYLAIVGVGVVVINNALKLIVDRDRPDIAALATAAGSSFPSGHSSAAAACWAAIALVVTRHGSRQIRLAAAAVAVFITVTVATTRVLLGVHWVSDVVAGVVVGWTWFLISTIAFGGRSLRLGEPAERIAATVPDPAVGSTNTDTHEESST